MVLPASVNAGLFNAMCEVGVRNTPALIHHCIHPNNILFLETLPAAISIRAKKEGEQ